jgi:hypothetical protein
MGDHLPILGVVDATLAEPDLVLVCGRERVVETPLVDPQRCGSMFTGRRRPVPKPRLWMYFCDSVIQ